jgi:glycosyltransferase involved in cell wall biosynthesis
MLIGIDASRANRDHKTGTEWYSYYLIRWLAKLDDKNRYILYTDKLLRDGLSDLADDRDWPENNSQAVDYDQDGFQIIKSPHNNFRAKVIKWPLKYFWTQGRLSIEMLFYKIDLLFVPAHTLPVIYPAKTVVTLHDVGFEKAKQSYLKENIVKGSKNANYFLNLLVRAMTMNKYGANNIDYLHWSTEFALKHATQIITVSEYTKKDLYKFYKPKSDNINVIYNGYNNDIYHYDLDENKKLQILKKYNITAPFLFYVGRIERKKNIPALIEAFAMVKQQDPSFRHKLVLAGDASFGYDETVYLIKEYGLDHDVCLLGWAEEHDLPYLYSAADAFIFPSIYEGFGIPLLQAMACGIPIAASNTTSIPEIVGPAALLFDPGDIQSIANALHSIVSDVGLRDKLKIAGAARVKNFSLEKCAVETLRLLNSL